MRLTFKALHDVVRAQGESIKKLEVDLGHRVTKGELEMVANTKASPREPSSPLVCPLSHTSDFLYGRNAGQQHRALVCLV